MQHPAQPRVALPAIGRLATICYDRARGVDEVMVATTKSTPCNCAICKNVDQLKLKILAHPARAPFNVIAGTRSSREPA